MSKLRATRLRTVCLDLLVVRVEEFMFVFGDAARLVWQARDFHKFLVHKFLRRYFWGFGPAAGGNFEVFWCILKGKTLQKADSFYRGYSGFGSRLVFFVATVCTGRHNSSFE